MTMSVLSNNTLLGSNMTISDLATMTTSNTTSDWMTMTPFWMEGVLTPVVSLLGLAGKQWTFLNGAYS